jgi:hypothetical protein
MELADGIGAHREPKREAGHVELRGVAVDAPAELEDALDVDARAGQHGRREGAHEVGVEPLIARRDRGVDGEHGAPPDLLQGRLEGDPVGHQFTCALDEQERGVTLVEVPRGGRDPQCPEGTHPTDAEHQLLVQPHLPATHIEGVGDGPVRFVVEGRVRVQQQQRHATHLDHPDGHVDRAPGQLHGHRQRVTDLVGDALERELRDVQVRISMLLVAVRVDRLAEVAVAVEEAHGHERQGHVRGGLAVIAREHAQATGVDGQGLVQPELGAEVGDRTIERLGMVAVVPVVGAVRPIGVIRSEQCPVLDHEVRVVE